MQLVEISLEAFVSWLCVHEHDVIGLAGKCFDGPLARWLSEMSGHVFGVDGKWYGPASSEYCHWRLLPRWAEVFCMWMESRAYRPITGRGALEVLAHVELVVESKGVRQACSGAA